MNEIASTSIKHEDGDGPQNPASTEAPSSERKLYKANRIKSEHERPNSPDSNCPICLGDLINKSFTNSCLHPFCFNCLKEWAKIKPECPLCKQQFTSIIHNIRSISDYDEHRLEPRIPLDSSHFFINFAIQQGLLRDREHLLFLWSQHGSVDPTIFQQMGLPHFTSPPTTPEFRRAVYRQGLWVRPSSSNRRRESSPEFYRNNPAQTHRLIPWLTRELSILLDVSMPTHNVCSDIMRLINLYPITSSTFRRLVTSYLGSRTDHFLHEFYNFAIAPENDMYAYDFNAVYASPPFAPVRRRVIPRPFRDFLNLSEDSDNENYGSNRTSQQAHFTSTPTTQQPSSPIEVIVVPSDESDIESSRHGADNSIEVFDEYPSGRSRAAEFASNAYARARVQTLENRMHHATHAAEMVIVISDDSDSETAIIWNKKEQETTLDDSDSDAQIIAELPPRHLREPEIVIIDSTDVESDGSDVNRKKLSPARSEKLCKNSGENKSKLSKNTKTSSKPQQAAENDIYLNAQPSTSYQIKHSHPISHQVANYSDSSSDSDSKHKDQRRPPRKMFHRRSRRKRRHKSYSSSSSSSSTSGSSSSRSSCSSGSYSSLSPKLPSPPPYKKMKSVVHKYITRKRTPVSNSDSFSD